MFNQVLKEHIKTPCRSTAVRHANIKFQRQQVFPLVYKGDYISSYIADLVVNNKVILEIKPVKKLNELHQAPIINYLKLSKIPVGYLLNFNSVRLEFQRFVNGNGF